jgi:hypothetical protein
VHMQVAAGLGDGGGGHCAARGERRLGCGQQQQRLAEWRLGACHWQPARLPSPTSLRGRPARRFLGEMTTPRRPWGIPTAVLSRDFQSKFYFTGQQSPTIKIRAPVLAVFMGNNKGFNV